jgi:hypothetical protein
MIKFGNTGAVATISDDFDPLFQDFKSSHEPPLKSQPVKPIHVYKPTDI